MRDHQTQSERLAANIQSLPPADRASARTRPTGVMLIALLCVVAVMVVGTYLVEAVLVLRDPGSPDDAAAARTTLALALGFMPLFLAMGIGLWRLKNWARLLAIGFLAVTIVSFFVSAVSRYPIGTGLLLGLNRGLIPGAMLLYLLHPAIGAVFQMSVAPTQEASR